MRFAATVHNSDGKILYAQQNATELALDGQTYVKGIPEGDLGDFYVADGEIKEKGSQPSEAYEFNYNTKRWVYDLSQHRGDKWAEIKSARSAEEFGTFEWNGFTFDCDEVSQRRIQGAVQLAALDNTTGMDWTLADNSSQTFNSTELQQVGQALGAHVNACHVKARDIRAQIDAATTEAELDAISW